MPALYEITEQMARMTEMMEQYFDPENPVELDEDSQRAISDTFESIELTYEEKIENCLKYMRSEEATANMYHEEEKRLAKLRKAAEGRAAHMKEMIIASMTTTGYDYKNKKKIQTTIGKVGFQKNPAKLEFIEGSGYESKIPYSYVTKVEKTFDKRALLADIKMRIGDNHKELDEQEFKEWGVKYVNNTSHLRVR